MWPACRAARRWYDNQREGSPAILEQQRHTPPGYPCIRLVDRCVHVPVTARGCMACVHNMGANPRAQDPSSAMHTQASHGVSPCQACAAAPLSCMRNATAHAACMLHMTRAGTSVCVCLHASGGGATGCMHRSCNHTHWPFVPSARGASIPLKEIAPRQAPLCMDPTSFPLPTSSAPICPPPPHTHTHAFTPGLRTCRAHLTPHARVRAHACTHNMRTSSRAHPDNVACGRTCMHPECLHGWFFPEESPPSTVFPNPMGLAASFEPGGGPPTHARGGGAYSYGHNS